MVLNNLAIHAPWQTLDALIVAEIKRIKIPFESTLARIPFLQMTKDCETRI